MLDIAFAAFIAIAAGFGAVYLGEKERAISCSSRFDNYPAAKLAALNTSVLLCALVMLSAIGFIGITLVNRHFTTKTADRSAPAAERK